MQLSFELLSQKFIFELIHVLDSDILGLMQINLILSMMDKIYFYYVPFQVRALVVFISIF